MTVRFVLKKPEAPFMANMAMDFASILSAEYADKMKAAETPEVDRPRADRHRAVPVRLVPEGRGDPLQGVRPALGRPAEDRQPGLRDHDRRVGALREAEDRRVPRDGVPEAGRRRADEERPEHQPGAAERPERRLHRVQRREEAVRQQAGAPGAEHGGQQEGDPRRGVPGRRPGREEPDPADALVATTTRSRTTRTTRPRRRRCWRRPAIRTASRSSSGTCR